MDAINYDQFRENLKKIITSSGKLTREVATDIGMAPGSLSRYVNGQRNPDLEHLIRISQYFHVSIDWLLGLSGEKYNVMPEMSQDFFDLYNLVSPSDKAVIDLILSKYKDNGKSE